MSVDPKSNRNDFKMLCGLTESSMKWSPANIISARLQLSGNRRWAKTTVAASAAKTEYNINLWSLFSDSTPIVVFVSSVSVTTAERSDE